MSLSLSEATNAKRAGVLFTSTVFAMYALTPFLVSLFGVDNKYFVELGQICLCACFGLVLGFKLDVFDAQFHPRARRFVITGRTFHTCVWAAFILFLIVTFATATSVPILSALRGAEPNELSQLRGEFLKGRVGIQLSLLYMSTVFTSTIVPYSLARLFIEKSRWRLPLAAIFFLFLVSYLNKALFFNLVFPLIYLVARRTNVSFARVILILAVSVGVLALLTVLALGDTFDVNSSESWRLTDYFSVAYTPRGVLDFLVWRSVAVPVFGATDTLQVFYDQFGGRPLLGATSSLLSAIFSMDRVNLERIVFENQYGGWSNIGNSNVVFFMDGFANFGWLGVFLFSSFVGQSLRWFGKSRDEALKSLWMLYCFLLLSGPLIGMMLSNGYLYMFFHALFVNVKPVGSRNVVVRPRRNTIVLRPPLEASAPN